MTGLGAFLLSGQEPFDADAFDTYMQGLFNEACDFSPGTWTSKPVSVRSSATPSSGRG